MLRHGGFAVRLYSSSRRFQQGETALPFTVFQGAQRVEIGNYRGRSPSFAMVVIRMYAYVRLLRTHLPVDQDLSSVPRMRTE